MGYVDGMSLTQQATSNPINAADPSGTATVQFYCRPLDGNPSGRFGHCYVQCCDNGNVCNRYSLLNGLQNGAMRGWSCIQRNDPRDNPARPGTIAVGPPVFFPQDVPCKCMDQIWRSMPGCRYAYDPESCNSNWFASAMYRCCTGKDKAPNPSGELNVPGLNSCCARSDVIPQFSCKPPGGGSYPGTDVGRYMCEDVAEW